jgi:hypothetical protein
VFPESDMRKKKRLILIALPLAVVAVTLGVLVMLPPRPGVTKTNCDRIQVGMTRAEVEEIFGGPSDPDHFYLGVVRSMELTQTREIWENNGFIADIVFDKNMHVKAIAIWSHRESFFDKLRRWLHLP